MISKLVRSPLWLVIFAFLLGGCESMQAVRDSVRERFTPVAPHVRVVQGRQGAVYDAARRAISRLGYQVAEGSRADGRLEGFTRVGSGEGFRSSYQRRIRVRLEPAGRDSLSVEVTIYEIQEDAFDQSSSPATETALRDSPAYDAFFAELQTQLQKPTNQ